jgi:SAM-dependent methyltransferase
VDELVAFCGLQPSKAKVLLEIGCGAGRMTRRFAELYGQVVALDVSDEMLRQGQANLADLDNVAWVLGSGADLHAIGDSSVDDVFSYITLQHLPDRAAVLRYVQDTGRALLAAAERSGACAELRSRGRRHLWVLLWSTGSCDAVAPGSPPPNVTLRPTPTAP